MSVSELLASGRAITLDIWVRRAVVLRAVAVTLVLGLVIAFASSDEYTANTKLLPYRSATSGGALAGLAGLAGVRLPSGVGDQTITADLYPVIAQTLDFRLAVAETPLRFSPTAPPTTLVKYFQEHRSLVRRVESAIADARTSVTVAVTGSKPLPTTTVAGADGTPLRSYSKEYLSIVQDLDRRLVVGIDKKTSVITITGLMPTPYAAADLVSASSERLMQRIIEYEAKKAGEQLKFITEQHRLSKERYEQAQRNLALFADRNRSLVSAVALIERDRLQRDFNIESEVFQQLSVDLQQATLKKNQDTPVFTVIEQVTVPSTRTSPRRTFIVLVALILGVLAGVAQILFTRMVGPSLVSRRTDRVSVVT